ncbi:MAG: hypothetical protein AB4038_22375 [Prochloraceae cyanobacterium]
MVEFTRTGTATAAVYFVSLSEELVFFEELQGLEAQTDDGNPKIYQAQSDGFLVAYIYEKNNGDRGYVQLYSYPDKAQLTELGKIASTSIHLDEKNGTYVQYNSATIPVPKNNYYKAEFTTPNSAQIKLSWIPLGIKSEA